jgi:uncharacterized membrane protein
MEQLLSKEDILQVEKAIAAAELNTSGEIRVHVEPELSGDVLDRAAYIFKKLKMHKTVERNGILIYLAMKSRKFAIIGDAGINSKVPENFWDVIKDNMARNFAEGRFSEGLSEGIRMAGEQLKTHFPYLKGDINELSNDISFGK